MTTVAAATAATIYADTSFFVSLYIPDRHTPEVERRLRSRPSLWMTPLHVAEWMHAIQQHVFREAISRSEAERLVQRFQEHRARNLWRESPMPDRALEICAELGHRHAARLGVRTLDTLHVASALELKAEHFWTFDGRQAKLAVAVGLKPG
ncbi:MAG: type II toxin-antitoxin system VapC family toxin [Acidobacteriia bacterium]|nr:type II toxin-antitoxin system VapC family toxin [Terriglobia bacterium]